MKKLIFFISIALALFSINAKAQFSSAAVIPFQTTDTLNNVDTVSRIFTASAGYNAVAIQPVVTKLSGTVAGYATDYGSLDGINYVSLFDTLHFTNIGINTAIWTKQTAPYPFYKVVYITSGTVSAIQQTFYVLRKNIIY